MTQQVDYDQMIKFHGHSCPGLAMGYRMTTAAMDYLDQQQRSEDEELVAITENNACGVDALQFISGCTFGKGNLIFHDYGKQVYTFYDRNTGDGVRVSLKQSEIPGDLRSNRPEFIKWLLAAAAEDLLEVKAVKIEAPEKARIMTSITCDRCGEAAMESRIESRDGKNCCIPCSQQPRSQQQ